MLTDIEQLTNIIARTQKTTLSELGLTVHFTNHISDDRYRWETYSKRIASFQTKLTVGTIVRLADIEGLLSTTYVFLIVGSKTVGNIVLYVDRVRLELEHYSDHFKGYRPVRCLSVIEPPNPSNCLAINRIIRQYVDGVNRLKCQRGTRPQIQHTLLSMLFEFAITGKIAQNTHIDT